MQPQSAPTRFAAEMPTEPSLRHEGPTPKSLLDALLDGAPSASDRSLGLLESFLKASSPAEALTCWLGPIADLKDAVGKRALAQRLNRDIARLDQLLNRQVNAILHHPRFQKLEASWRGLTYLVGQVAEGSNIKVRVLDLSWEELVRDQQRALEFDQSQLFRKVYEEEFGTPGGEPFGVLLGDYEIHLHPSAEHPTDDVATLGSIASVAAAAFAPFIAAAHPSLLELNSFTGLEKSLDLGRTYAQVEYVKWRALRQQEDARFVGLTLPRILMRLPYRDDSARPDGFCFRENVEALPDRGGYLWGNAAYAFGAVLVRAFASSGWLAAIRGVRRGEEEGGVVTGLPVHSFSTDRLGVAGKTSTEIAITEMQDKELSDQGFLPLCPCPDTELSVFYGSQSLQKPQTYNEQTATVNARLSAMLQYMLCVSRFAHYLKVIARDKTGKFLGPDECEDYLRRWLMSYTNANDNAGPDIKARHPLREAKVQVREVPGRPGRYMCVAHLRPHFQLDQMISTVRLVTRLTTGQAG
ncbi:MAG TPA: type VI secretion system contractile sheath large subunit [Gemmataceae bacterium]